MTIEQTVEIPANYRYLIEFPRTAPSGTMARVIIDIPTAFSSSAAGTNGNIRSFRGILKDKGISVERLREMQREDKALENSADERQK